LYKTQPTAWCLVVVETGEMVHNGNFHPIGLAIAFDALRVAIAHVGLLSERRMSHLWAEFFTRRQSAEPPSDRCSAWGFVIRRRHWRPS
jgi:histidine ammonia-lyase